MATTRTPFTPLELPAELDDLSGLLDADIRAMVTMLTQMAFQRLPISAHRGREFGQELWNGITGAVNQTIGQLHAEMV